MRTASSVLPGGRRPVARRSGGFGQCYVIVRSVASLPSPSLFPLNSLGLHDARITPALHRTEPFSPPSPPPLPGLRADAHLRRVPLLRLSIYGLAAHGTPRRGRFPQGALSV